MTQCDAVRAHRATSGSTDRGHPNHQKTLLVAGLAFSLLWGVSVPVAADDPTAENVTQLKEGIVETLATWILSVLALSAWNALIARGPLRNPSGATKTKATSDVCNIAGSFEPCRIL